MIGRSALANITNQGGEVMDSCEGHSPYTPAIAECLSEPLILVKAFQWIKNNCDKKVKDAYNKYNS